MAATRFNKIAIQGAPQMAVDKEAIISLSRVYSNYSKCNLPLFYTCVTCLRAISLERLHFGVSRVGLKSQGAIQVLRNADGGGGGCLIFWKKALRRCNIQCY